MVKQKPAKRTDENEPRLFSDVAPRAVVIKTGSELTISHNVLDVASTLDTAQVHRLESSLHFQIFPPFLVLPRDCPMQPEVRPGPVASILRGWRCNRAGKSGVNRGNPVYFFVGHRDLRAFLADTDHFCFRRGK